MNQAEAKAKLTACVGAIEDGPTFHLLTINLKEVLAHLEAVPEPQRPAKGKAVASSNKLRGHVSKLEADNARLKETLSKTSKIVQDVVKAGEAPNRYIPAELLRRARDLLMKGMVLQVMKGKERGKK